MTGGLEGPRDRERLRTVVVADPDELAGLLADWIVAVIRRDTTPRGRCVLGLATGSAPLGVYRDPIRRHRAGEVDFSRVIAFNLDEYYPMPPDSPHGAGGIDFQLLGIGQSGHIGFQRGIGTLDDQRGGRAGAAVAG